MAQEEYGLAVAIWDLEGDPLELGLVEYTKGGSVLRYSEEHWGPTYDQYGNAPVDQIKVGESVEVDVMMAEMVLEKFAAILPSARLVTGAGGKKKLVFGGKIGEGLGKYAKTLTLRPYGNLAEGRTGPQDDDPSGDFTILRAVPRAEFEIAFQLQQERIYQLTFTGLIDRTQGGALWVFGDNAVTAG